MASTTQGNYVYKIRFKSPLYYSATENNQNSVIRIVTFILLSKIGLDILYIVSLANTRVYVFPRMKPLQECTERRKLRM